MAESSGAALPNMNPEDQVSQRQFNSTPAVENNEDTRNALCILQTRSKLSVEGVLCKAKFGGQLLSLFIATEREPTTSQDDLCDAMLNFPILKMQIPLTRDRVAHVWCPRLTKSTVVELSTEAATECMLRGANFLNVGEVCRCEEVRFNNKLDALHSSLIILNISLITRTCIITLISTILDY